MSNGDPRDNDEARPAPRAALPAPMQNEISSQNSATKVEMQRAVAEVQAAIYLAKQFPRDVDKAIKEIMQECSRLELAEVATYEYARGGSTIDGPTIRLAEVLALAWQNIHSGWKERGRYHSNGAQYADIESWAWDVERNRREPIEFTVKLSRDTKKGSYPLTDERDIYEHCANQAKRRERAAILAIIPTYIADMAVDKCNDTLKKSVTSEKIKAMIDAFEKIGITTPRIEAFIQSNIAAIKPTHVVRLRKIYNSLRDGMSHKEDWFSDVAISEQPKNETSAPVAVAISNKEPSPEKPKEEPKTTPKTNEQKPLFGAD